MYQGKHLQKQNNGTRRHSKKTVRFLLSLLLIVMTAVGGTLAYLSAQSGPLENTFAPAQVSCEVTERFDGITKKNVNVKNTGDTDAFLRVRLVSYRVNDAGQRIGGTALIPPFVPGIGWVWHNGYYYYTQPVAPNESPATALIPGIVLTGSYLDADGGKQVIEVLAEAIQSSPAEAVGVSWGVTISNGTVSAYQ